MVFGGIVVDVADVKGGIGEMGVMWAIRHQLRFRANGGKALLHHVIFKGLQRQADRGRDRIDADWRAYDDL